MVGVVEEEESGLFGVGFGFCVFGEEIFMDGEFFCFFGFGVFRLYVWC